jgi:MtrB/PioB family decaheme-associated outer membrane protein
MTKQSSLRVLALAGVCLVPLAAAAQELNTGTAPGAVPANYNNEIDVGARYQSSTSTLFGRYTGNDSKGIGSLGAFHLKGGDATDSGGTQFMEATGSNLNFQPDYLGSVNGLAPESELGVTFGNQGTWKANLYYNAISYVGQTFLSPYTVGGGLAPGQVAFGGQTVTGTSPTGVPILSTAPTSPNFGTANYYVTHPFPEVQETAGTRRDIFGADGKLIEGNWTFTSGVRREHKEGTVLQTIYSSNAGIAFPEPVNYDSDRFNVTAAYNTRQVQAQIGYVFSKFSDNNTFTTLPYLFASTAQFTSQYSLPPSSAAHYINGSAGYNLTPTTRATLNFQYGLEMSDAPLGLGTATPAAQIGSTFAGLMGQNESLTGELARVYTATAALSSRPLSKLDLKVSYGIDGRDNDANRAAFNGDEHGDGAPSIQYVLQQNWTKQKATAEAGYNVLGGTKVSVGYRFDDTDRSAGAIGSDPLASIAWVGHSSENTEWAKIADHTFANVNGSLTVEHAVRTGVMELAPGSNAVSATGVANASAPYYEAPRTADRAKLRADYTPSDEWTIGASGKYETNHYNYPKYITGTERDYNASAGPDVTYSPTKAIALHGFYNYEEIYYVNDGNGVPSTLNGNKGWSAATTNSVHTAGLSADWKVTDRLKLGTEYTFSYGDVAYNLFDGGLASASAVALSYQNVQNLPSVDSSMHSIKVRAEYKLADNVTLMGGYGFDLFKDNDWAYGWNPVVAASTTGLPPLTVNTFTSAESQPSYRVHSLYTSLRVKF